MRTGSAELAYKGLGGVPLWLLAVIAVVGLIAFGITQTRRRR
ncbi:hypothetical protein AB0I16_27045 [Streptomyces sp. NPDC050703]